MTNDSTALINHELDQARRLMANLAHELAQARAENRRLRPQVQPRHGYHATTAPRILNAALDNAKTLLLWRAADLPIARDFAQDAGMTRTKFLWAIALLRSCRIMAPRGREFLIDDIATAETRLTCKHNDLITRPNALEILRLYAPKQMAHTYQPNKNTG